jgi:aminobenzoyl-glutamate utilization protein B
MRKTELTRRGLIAAGAGLGITSTFDSPVLAQFAAQAQESSAPAQPPASVAAAEAAVEAHRDAILRISREVWEKAEISIVEVESFKVHLRELEAAGFTTVSTGTSGYPTAFVSEWTQGSGGPVIAYLPEYDALPGLGNAPEPRQTPAASGITDGHGCGHNMLGAGCTGGALALKSMMQASGLPGTLRVYGCASEEAEGAKVYFVRDGLFDDVDIALAWHPAPFAGTGEVSTAANAAIKIRFTGQTAHAGLSPWDGRSALKGAELFGIGIQFMREHVLPTTRLHYVYEEAGVAPNVVPDVAQVWLTIRGANGPDVKAVLDWAHEIADGAALMTQTKVEFNHFYGMNELVPNLPLIGLVQAHLDARPPVWTDEEQAFARACQAAMGLPEAGMATSVLPTLPPTKVGGSSDLGDISKVVPLGVFGWPTVGLGTSMHTWAVTAAGGMSIGDRASLDTARILAGVGHDLLADAGLRAAAKADLEVRVAKAPMTALLPVEQKAPLRLPDWMRKGPGEEFTSLQG